MIKITKEWVDSKEIVPNQGNVLYQISLAFDQKPEPHTSITNFRTTHTGFQNSPVLLISYTPCGKRPGPRLNIKTVFPRYGYSHVKDKTVGETVLSLTWESLYW